MICEERVLTMKFACIARPEAKLSKMHANFAVVQAHRRVDILPRRARAKTQFLTRRKICTETVIVTDL